MTNEKPAQLPQKDQPPTFKPVIQKGDFDDGFACVAMIVGKEIDEIRRLAIEKFGHPNAGPYWVGFALINKLMRHFGWNVYDYEPVEKPADLPDLALLLVQYNEETDIGRLVLFHRARANLPKASYEYALDPAYWINDSSRRRIDYMKLQPAYFMEIKSTPKSVGGPL